MSLQKCSVVDTGCDGLVHTRCFACGLPVCRECSVIVASYYRYGRKRVCHTCIPDHIDHIALGEPEKADLHARGIDPYWRHRRVAQ